MVIENKRPRGFKEENDPKFVPAHDIDAYWLQRQIGEIYEDAHIQSEKTKEAEQIMSGTEEDGGEKQLREVENELMELFDYEHHEVVQRHTRMVCLPQVLEAQHQTSRYRRHSGPLRRLGRTPGEFS